jgi:hypothetical protein
MAQPNATSRKYPCKKPLAVTSVILFFCKFPLQNEIL